jgi:hypothetical protein
MRARRLHFKTPTREHHHVKGRYPGGCPAPVSEYPTVRMVGMLVDYLTCKWEELWNKWVTEITGMRTLSMFPHRE